jgi:hypothetical protein
MRGVLPRRWFVDPPPTDQPPSLLQALLSGFGSAWAAMYALVTRVELLSRIATATGVFLDIVSVDFFGSVLPRRPGEADDPFRLRIQQELFRPRTTRSSLDLVLNELTGRPPTIFEPVRPADTGGYGIVDIGYWVGGGVGYSVAGGWGNLALRHNSFVTVQRPLGVGIPDLAGYNTGGYSYYGDPFMVATPVTDANIFAAIVAVLPAGHIAWVRIEG